MRTITGLFDTHDQADRAVRSLKDAGIASDDISIVANGADGVAATDGDDVAEGAGAGAGIGAAVGQAAAFQKELNAKKAGAMAAAQNYGTFALEAKQSDWNDIGTGAGSSNNSNLLTFGLLAAGAYLLLGDEK